MNAILKAALCSIGGVRALCMYTTLWVYPSLAVLHPGDVKNSWELSVKGLEQKRLDFPRMACFAFPFSWANIVCYNLNTAMQKYRNL